MKRVALVLVVALAAVAQSDAAEYEVGPGKALNDPLDVPWESLEPGDTVSIHWRAESYRSKWVICRRGTPERPITVRGVLGPKGERPVIDGRDAATRKTLSYWHEPRSVIKIGGATRPADTFPAWLVIENLEVCGGRPPFSYQGTGGAGRYADYTGGIFIEKGEHITIRGCTLRDNANGLVISSQSKEMLVEGCWIHDNGVEGSVYSHNVYTCSAGMVYQHNRFGPLRAGCPGNNLKDRSAGLIVRYNWIEGGNRELDLVDAEDRASVREDPRYDETLVYGNVLIEPDGDGNDQIVHYGGDSGHLNWYRKGVLQFYHNTVVSRRRDKTMLFRLSSPEQRVDCRNNIVLVTAPGRNLALVGPMGSVELRNNWFKTGWENRDGLGVGQITGGKTSFTGESPGFLDLPGQDYHLAASSPCIGKAGSLAGDLLKRHPVLREYVNYQTSRARPGTNADHSATDLGAFGFANK